MIIPVNNYDLHEKSLGARDLAKEPYPSLKNLKHIDSSERIDCVNDKCSNRFYPFYGATSVRRNTSIFRQHRNNRKKRSNRKRVISKKVNRIQRLDIYLKGDKLERKKLQVGIKIYEKQNFINKFIPR